MLVLVVSAKADGERGDRAGCKTCTLCVGVSEVSGCWMSGARMSGSLWELRKSDVVWQAMRSTVANKTHLLPSEFQIKHDVLCTTCLR